MSTAPKLTYAKIGNKTRNKIQPNSTELIRHQQQQSEDLFSHMNQDNLNYIKKELKLKKNRSEHDKSRTNNNQDDRDGLQEQITQRDKIYHKYKGEEQVSERDPYLEDTERKSIDQKPFNILLAQQVQEDYADLMQDQNLKEEKKKQTPFQNTDHQKPTNKTHDNKMYHSLPYQQPKKRVVSIEGYFRESVSTNLQKFKEDGHHFIEFLEDYISDLNQNKHLKSRPHEQSQMDKRHSERGQNKHIKENMKHSTHRKESNQSERVKQDFKKIQKLKRNSDTFGQPNSKYTVNSVSYESMAGDLQFQLKRQKPQQIQVLRESLLDKDSIIQKLKLSNELLEEQITHLKAKQEIILKNKGEAIYDTRQNPSYKQTKRANNENLVQDYRSLYNQFQHSHHRHGSVNPSVNRNGYSSRQVHNSHHHQQQQQQQQKEQAANAEFNQNLFKQFQTTNKERQNTPRKEHESIEKLYKQYKNFMQQSSFNAKKSKANQYK